MRRSLVDPENVAPLFVSIDSELDEACLDREPFIFFSCSRFRIFEGNHYEGTANSRAGFGDARSAP